MYINVTGFRLSNESSGGGDDDGDDDDDDVGSE